MTDQSPTPASEFVVVPSDLLASAAKMLASVPYGDWPGKNYAEKTIAANELIGNLQGVLAASPTPADEQECPVSALPSGKHQVDTSMEIGPNNCFFCGQPMGGQ